MKRLCCAVEADFSAKDQADFSFLRIKDASDVSLGECDFERKHCSNHKTWEGQRLQSLSEVELLFNSRDFSVT